MDTLRKFVIKDVNDMAKKMNKEIDAYLDLMQEYIEHIEKMPADEKEEFSKKSLEESGLITKAGNLRKLCSV